MNKVLVAGSFDQLFARQVRFLQAAAEIGPLQVLLWDDPAAQFTLAERLYVLQALRYMGEITRLGECTRLGEYTRPFTPAAGSFEQAVLAALAAEPAAEWVYPEWEDTPARQAFCTRHGLPCRVLRAEDMPGFPAPALPTASSNRPKVVVTGCFDWLHSGHVRFFEETAALGDLYAVVGSDANVRLLKGAGRPLFSQDERRFLVGAVRHVTAALISSGQGWLDAEPEIALIQPAIYAVNEDGDKPEKRAFCAAHGLEYRVLARNPAPGLPRRSSTELRGF